MSNKDVKKQIQLLKNSRLVCITIFKFWCCVILDLRNTLPVKSLEAKANSNVI